VKGDLWLSPGVRQCIIGLLMNLPDDQLRPLLLQNKLLDEKTLLSVENFARESGIGLAEAIGEKNVISDEQLGEITAQAIGIPFVNISRIQIAEDAFQLVPERTARRQKIIPFARSPEEIKVATSEPGNKEAIEMLEKKTGQRVVVFYATEKDIRNMLSIYKRDIQRTIDNYLKEDTGLSKPVMLEDPPMAKIVDTLIEDAYREKASDIHIEPQESESLVRFRIDGILHDVIRLPKQLHDRVVTRIKVLSSLRTDEHMGAQDGKMRMLLEEENLDIRVSIIPIASGEKVVLRLLSSKSREYTLTDLGMNDADLDKVTRAFSQTFGMILSTGPTGSGKTTSIYAILKILNTREKNITTIEDPVEYRIKGANQIQVNTRTNLTFANGLRSVLRQDPNIIFVGEIRDNETAGIAVNAALTGHLVLSTLHTNDAATAIPRLVDMKVEPYLVASTVNIVIAQRLVRKICEVCKVSTVMSLEELAKSFPMEAIKRHFIPVGPKREIRVYLGKGCKSCHFTGYAGRLGIFEVLEVTKEIRELIAEKADSDVIAKAAIDQGMKLMIDDGMEKVGKGMTTVDEVVRVTKVEAS
jgi:type IV pilus assembly protein PilB